MNTLTNKIMSATLGLALVLGTSLAMTAAGSVLAPSNASAKTLSRVDLVRNGVRKKLVNLGQLKETKQLKRVGLKRSQRRAI